MLHEQYRTEFQAMRSDMACQLQVTTPGLDHMMSSGKIAFYYWYVGLALPFSAGTIKQFLTHRQTVTAEDNLPFKLDDPEGKVRP